jgi:hypothetical protein
MNRTHCPVTLEILRSGGLLTEVAEEVLSAPQFHSFSIVAHSESKVSDKYCCGGRGGRLFCVGVCGRTCEESGG